MAHSEQDELEQMKAQIKHNESLNQREDNEAPFVKVMKEFEDADLPNHRSLNSTSEVVKTASRPHAKQVEKRKAEHANAAKERQQKRHKNRMDTLGPKRQNVMHELNSAKGENTGTRDCRQKRETGQRPQLDQPDQQHT